ncbi:MAG: hypothetical protein L6Q51_03150 [Cyclobacteriaceae bacterium]|nr:hypothetical protein [Cyclobacteriaceae bacterium]
MSWKIQSTIMVMALASALPMTLKAQNEDDLVRFLQANRNDGNKLITAYINPFVEGFSYALNGGWFHTAKPHKLGGFDINISLTPVFIPSSQDRFNPDNLQFENIAGFANTTNPGKNPPTFIGPKERTTYYFNYDFDGDGNVNTAGNLIDPDDTFSGPEGLGLRESLKVAAVGSPMMQVGIGLIKGTDVMVRFVPKTTLGSTEVKLLGFGVRHDIKQHIPAIKMLPFDLSVMAAYTSFNGVTDLSGLATEFPPATSGTTQEAIYKFNAFLFQALVSKKIAFLTVFGGVGYNGIKTTADVRGSYTFFNNTVAEFDLTNPYSATFKNNSMRFDVGFRLNLLAFYIYGDYTIQEYSSVTAGLGFTFR